MCVHRLLFSHCGRRIISTCALADDCSLIFCVKWQLNQQLRPSNSALFSFYPAAGSGRSGSLLSHGRRLRYRHRISLSTGNVWKLREKWYSLMGKAENSFLRLCGNFWDLLKFSLLIKPNSGLLRCDTVSLGKWFQEFRRNISFFYRCTVHFEIYVVHSPTNALFINSFKSFKFILKYTIISLLRVSVFNDHHQGALSLPS